MRLPIRERKSVVMPEDLRYTTPVKGSSRREPTERMGKPRALPARVWIMALKPRSTLPLPMISVTSWREGQYFDWAVRGRQEITHAGVVGLEESNLEAFVGEVALGLSKVDGGMVGSGMPVTSQYRRHLSTTIKDKRANTPVGQKSDLFSSHLECCSGEEASFITSVNSTLDGERENRSSPFAGITQIKFYAWKEAVK